MESMCSYDERKLTMNEDMPWVNLTQEEVEELRKSKKQLTEYGKEKLRELMKDNGRKTEQ